MVRAGAGVFGYDNTWFVSADVTGRTIGGMQIYPAANQLDRETADHAFEPGFWPYTIDAQRALLAFVQARNQIVRELGAEMNIRVVDLYAYFDTTACADFREAFQDMIHIRSGAYPALAAFLHGRIADLL